MRSSFMLMDLPMTPLQRNSLPDQVAERLRVGIMETRWTVELPSESELCRELNVSRMTLRRAFAQLVRDRWISPGGRGRHHRILKRLRARKKAFGRIVRVLRPFSIYSLGSIQHALLETVAERLGSAGYRLEYEHRPALFSRHAPAELERLAALPDTAVWMLYFATEPMQRWFAENNVPCLAFGRLYPGVNLPSVCVDGPAISRHAAGLFYQRGHREMVYLIAEFTSLTDRLAAEAFVQEAQRLGARARIIAHDREPSALSHKLGVLLAAHPRPTAFFSSCPEHCLTILCHLREAGLRVSADASIIAGWDDEFLQFTIPNFACYRADAEKAGRRVAAFLLDIIRHGTKELRTANIVPTFVPGGTLGLAPRRVFSMF